MWMQDINSEWIKNHLETKTDFLTTIIPLFLFSAEKCSFSTVQFLLLGFGGLFLEEEFPWKLDGDQLFIVFSAVRMRDFCSE